MGNLKQKTDHVPRLSWPEQRRFWMPFLHGLAAVVAHPGCVSEFLALSTEDKMRLIPEDMPVRYREGGY